MVQDQLGAVMLLRSYPNELFPHVMLGLPRVQGDQSMQVNLLRRAQKGGGLIVIQRS